MNCKIGIGILTCNRWNYYNKCLSAIHGIISKNINTTCIYETACVNDGQTYVCDSSDADYVSNHSFNLGVSYSKNELLSYLLSKGCDYIFIIEDDIELIDEQVFSRYIQAYKRSGIHHFMCGSFLPSRGKSIETFKYKNSDVSISVYRNCAGSFTFYTRECLLNTGMFDEHYWNALEHVDLTYRLSLLGYTTPFGYFADIANSDKYIRSIGGEFNDSIINKTNNKKVEAAFAYFEQKFGVGFPAVYSATKDDLLNYVNTQSSKTLNSKI